MTTFHVLALELTALGIAVYLYVFNLGGAEAKRVLTLEPLRHRAFWDFVWPRPGRHRPGRHAGTPRATQRPEPAAAVTADRPVVIDGVLDVLTRREMGEDESGAEHWGDLLKAMNTAEQVIFHQETYLLHQDLRAITDPLIAAYDARFAELMRQWDHRAERVSLGSSEALTGEWPMIYAAEERASA